MTFDRRFQIVLIGLLGLIGGGVALHLAMAPDGEPTDEVVDPSRVPWQEDLSEELQATLEFEGIDDFRVRTRARYRVAARILSTQRYRSGWESDLSPVDLALGWAGMAAPSVDDHITWSQSNRWYFYRWGRGCPYGKKEIISSSANTHIIPATENLRRAVLRLSRGDIVLLEGYLVRVDGADGRYWISSTSREDTGRSSCEVMVVERLVLEGLEYR